MIDPATRVTAMPRPDQQAHNQPRLRRTAQAMAGADLRIWRRRDLVYTDLVTAAGLTLDLPHYELAARGLVWAAFIRPIERFTASGLTSLTLSLGVAGNLTKYAAAYNVAVAPGAAVFQLSTISGIENLGAATPIRIAAVAVGADLKTLTAGRAEVRLLTASID